MNPLFTLVQKIDDLELWKEEKLLKRNEYLSVQGNTDTNLYFVVEGCFRIYVIDEDAEHTIRFGYKNNFITALDSFISEKSSDFYIQALKKSKVKIIDKATYLTFINSTPENITLWNILLEQLIVQQMERERDLLTSSPLVRYNRIRERSPQLFQEVPSKYIASYLRMTPETLSRLKKS